MQQYLIRIIVFYLLTYIFPISLPGQLPINFKEERAAEQYAWLRDSVQLHWTDAIKYIRLGTDRNSYLSLGGSLRPRFEHFTNRFWVEGNEDNYYSQRLSLHTDIHLGTYLRIFGELYQGYKTGDETVPQSDVIAIHQAFVELSIPTVKSLLFRFGRQEMKLGAGRLVDIRVGPNLRRSFDQARFIYQSERLTLNLFYGKEVQIGFNAFDNDFSLFDTDAANPRIWGFHSQCSIFKTDDVDDNNDLYYLGYQSDFSAFADGAGKETRHSLGIRRFGTIGHKFQYNTELIFQFGDLAGKSIRAFNVEADWKYTFTRQNWRPTIGLKFDWSSGDRELGDDRVNSFNPLFVNPSIYSLAAVNTPVNLLSFHPSLILFPSQKLMINLEYAIFYRSSLQDGLYAPPSILTRPADGIRDRHIGDTIGLFIKYTANRHLSFDIRSSYFLAGSFVEKSGPSKSIFQFTPTLTLQL